MLNLQNSSGSFGYVVTSKQWDSDLEYLFWRFDKPITLSEKKLTLEAEQFQRGLRCELIIEIDNMKIEEGDSLQMRK